MKRNIKKGDFFKVELNSGEIRYFQFVDKDKTDLNGDVIRIFSRHYCVGGMESIEEILEDTVECYMHTSISMGIKLGFWSFYSKGVAPNNLDIFFRTSDDVGLYPNQHFVSSNWVIWKMNGARQKVGKLPERFHSTDLGGIYAPQHVIYRLEHGEAPDQYYPLY